MERKSIAKKVHCLVLAFPGQGHINPMLQFSKLLQHEGVKITLATTTFYSKNMQKLPASITFETISDGFDNGRVGVAKSLKEYMDTFWQVGQQTLEELIEKLGRKGNHVDCLIYDSFFPWGIDIAKKCGIVGAVFLTQTLAVSSIYYHFNIGKLQVPITKHGVSLPQLPQLQLEDLPSFFCNYAEDSIILDFLSAQFSDIYKADWVLCNTLYELEKEMINWTMKIWPKLRTIGPSIPSMFINKKIENDEDYGDAQFTNEECLKWLDDKPKVSVVYISFGTMVAISDEQLEELAYGLKDSGSYFLWAIRDSEQTKLPKDFELKSEKGLVVAWCSQLKILAHEAISCFVTHCGWNSSLESLSLGVPMIAMPQWSDQYTNAKFIADVWKIGIRAKVDERKIVTREVLKHCIWEIMDSDRGKEVKSNVFQWKTLAVGAVGEGGSSHKNIKEFMDALFHL
ncbi:PREDICTED: UDP-glycosyltransferase 74E1-like [Lupinus angustifolius]|nr:PREDICTED: UDP-glycosyltransferase 74E1-like [Lupinus angustifolius]